MASTKPYLPLLHTSCSPAHSHYSSAETDQTGQAEGICECHFSSSVQLENYKTGVDKLMLRFFFCWELSLCIFQPGAIGLPIFSWTVSGDWANLEGTSGYTRWQTLSVSTLELFPVLSLPSVVAITGAKIPGP